MLHYHREIVTDILFITLLSLKCGLLKHSLPGYLVFNPVVLKDCIIWQERGYILGCLSQPAVFFG